MPSPARRRALVTGGPSGIGRSIALVLARAAQRIAVLDLDLTSAEQVASDIRKSGDDAFAVRASVSDPAELEQAFAAVDGDFGVLDVLVNNAGITVNKPSLELSIGEWQKVIDVNLSGTFYCSQLAARRMIVQGSGSIVNIGSIYSLVAAPNRVAYCAAKAGIAMMTKTLAIEWAESGIQVNAVAPGYVQTQLTDELVKQGRLDLNTDTRRTPYKRLAQPDEIAEAVLFLASEKASYITGQVLAVDGGWTAYGYL